MALTPRQYLGILVVPSRIVWNVGHAKASAHIALSGFCPSLSTFCSSVMPQEVERTIALSQGPRACRSCGSSRAKGRRRLLLGMERGLPELPALGGPSLGT